MIKKWMAAAALTACCAAAAHAGIIKASVTAMRSYFRVGSPLSSSVMTSWGVGQEATQAVTLAASSAGAKNCIKSIVAVGTSTGSLRVLDGGTTVYATVGSSYTTMGGRFDDEELCGSNGAAMYITFSTAARATTLDSQVLSFSAYTY
jgi:hypothetical protein